MSIETWPERQLRMAHEELDRVGVPRIDPHPAMPKSALTLKGRLRIGYPPKEEAA